MSQYVKEHIFMSARTFSFTLNSAMTRTFIAVVASSLAFASSAAGATATLYAKGIFATPEPTFGGAGESIITQPGGGIYHGTHFWLADGIAGLVRLNVPGLPGQNTETYEGYAAGGSYGQVAYDVVHDAFYVADQTSRKSLGIVRLSFAPNEQLSNACFIAPSLGGRRPSAVALGPDGNLYAGFLTSGDIVKLSVGALTPPPGCPLPVPAITIGKSVKGGRVNGLTFVGGDLYIAGKDGLTKIVNAAACTGGCVSQTVAGSAANVGHFGIWSDGADTIYYLRDANVMVYRLSTGVHQVFANSGSLPDGTVTSFSFVGGNSNLLTQDAYGNLWVGDDTSDGAGNASGRIWFIAAGQPPLQ
jgi:hypothetical protein